VRAWINPGSLDSPGAHDWNELSGSFAGGVGVEGSKIRLADIDGKYSRLASSFVYLSFPMG
jgi:hypothetical protein